MAETLYLPDGSCEVVIGDPAGFLENLIERRLGRDCCKLYQDIVSPVDDDEAGDDFERIADGYLQQLHGVLDELDGILAKPKLSRKALENLRMELYNNL